MDELLENIKKNYKQINIDSVEKIKDKTINDIYFINNNYVLKIYNVDNESQVVKSIETQKIVHDSLKIAPDVLLNIHGKAVTEFQNKLYCIQELILEDDKKIDIVKKVAIELAAMHKEFRKLNREEYKFEKKSKNFNDIKDSIIKNINDVKNNLDEDLEESINALLDTRLKLLEKYQCEYKPEIYQVIHGDIRPSNVICQNNKAYFIDFDFISYGDFLFEIGSAAMLISNFNIDEANRFLDIYNNCINMNTFDKKQVFINLLSYYVQSSFPIRLIGKIENTALKQMINGRIDCLEFCNKILESEY